MKQGIGVSCSGALGGLLFWLVALYSQTGMFADLTLGGQLAANLSVGAAAGMMLSRTRR